MSSCAMMKSILTRCASEEFCDFASLALRVGIKPTRRYHVPPDFGTLIRSVANALTHVTGANRQPYPFSKPIRRSGLRAMIRSAAM